MQQISDFMSGGKSSLTASPLVKSHLDTRILANATVSAEMELAVAESSIEYVIWTRCLVLDLLSVNDDLI